MTMRERKLRAIAEISLNHGDVATYNERVDDLITELATRADRWYRRWMFSFGALMVVTAGALWFVVLPRLITAWL